MPSLTPAPIHDDGRPGHIAQQLHQVIEACGITVRDDE